MTNQHVILEGCKNNDRKSQEKLYRHFFPSLYTLCRRFFDDEQDILSAINNGMLRVFKNISQYDDKKSKLETWMHSIVRNEALTIIRNQKNKIKTEELTEDLSAEAMKNPFINTIEEDIYLLLSKLTRTTRAICNLYYLEGYNIREIGVLMEIKEGTVKWHLSEGRKQIQSNLETNKNRIIKAG